MKIAICGSMAFAREMLETKKALEQLGHEVIVPINADKYADGLLLIEDKWQKTEQDLIKNWYKVIQSSDAVLIINISKNNVENYIGGNALIEMAFAHILNKKIFLLNSIPKMSYTDEIESFVPIVIQGDYTKFKN